MRAAIGVALVAVLVGATLSYAMLSDGASHQATGSPTLAVAPTRTPTTATPAPTLSPSPVRVTMSKATSCNASLVPGATMEPQPVLRAKRTFALHIPVLMYHRIVPYADATGSLRGLIVPPSVFAGQLDALQRSGWHTITAAQLADDLAAGITPTPKTFVLTIDDGWGDGYTYAMPILAAHGFVGTFYVIAGRIDSGSFLTSAQLRDLVAAGDEIGDHTMDHVALEHQGPTRLAYEIDAAAATIASATGQWPTTLAYPTGSFDMTTEHAVQACAPMKMAVIEGQATYETWSTRFQIPRLKVTADMTPGALLAVMTNPPLPPIAKSK